MSVFEKYKLKRPAEFTRLVGVNYGTFQIILEKLENEITRFKQQKPMRKHGLKSSLTIADQLLLTLIYLRQYHTFLQVGKIFSISESYAQKRYCLISKHLMKALDLPNDKSLTAENLKLVADVTEQEIERPVSEQKSYYSGKKSDPPLKPC
jgi:Helix-turn-helix of DDE superfamily endonuclease